MPRKLRLLLLALVIVALAVVAFFVLISGPGPARPPLPNPNGRDDLLKAGSLLTSDAGAGLSLKGDALRTFVSTNAESLRLLRLGLSRQCLMPMDWTLKNFGSTIGELADFKHLAQLLAAEGRFHEMENHPADAARSYTDAISFGNEMSRGGFLITRLVGVACESIGYNALIKLLPRLDSDQARAVVKELEKIDASHVTWTETVQGEKQFARYEIRNHFNPIIQISGMWQNRQAMRKSAVRHDKLIAFERLLTVELALRCCQSEQAHSPTTLADLVPKYLSRVPLDPFSGKPLIYRPQGTNWLLYSVGENGVDDGGKRTGPLVSGALTRPDLFYDSP